MSHRELVVFGRASRGPTRRRSRDGYFLGYEPPGADRLAAEAASAFGVGLRR